MAEQAIPMRAGPGSPSGSWGELLVSSTVPGIDESWSIYVAAFPGATPVKSDHFNLQLMSGPVESGSLTSVDWE
jgi:hypothetical protein